MENIYPNEWIFSLLPSLTKKKMSALTLAIMLLWQTPLQAKDTLAEIKISISVNDVPLKKALRKIETKTGLKFFYISSQIDTDRKVTIEAYNAPLNVVLNNLFKDTDISYNFRGNQILLKKPAKNSDLETHNNVTDDADGAPEVTKAASSKMESAETVLVVTGRVIDESNVPLPGVNVLIKGTSKGTTTNADGNYSLEVPDEGAVLLFSFIGYTTQEISVEGRTTINVSLLPDVKSLEEVVVVGYGTAKKSDLTGAVGSVNAEAIIRNNPIQAARALQGMVAGVNVNRINSRPGSDYTIDIRGLHSISYSSKPLVVIDGVMGGRLNTLNPADIETIDVLKDASATAIYGARGANGVIIVTTKKGKQGKTRVTYDGYVGVKTPNNLPDLMTAQEFYHAYNDVVKAENPSASPFWTAAELKNVQTGKTVDWVDEITDPSFQTSHVIALSGGSENTTHYFSAGYLNENGTLLNTGFKRYNLKGSIDSKLNDVVKVGVNTYYTSSVLNLGSNEALRSAYRARPTGTIYYDSLDNPAETSDKNVKGYAFWMGIRDTQTQNPILEVAKENMQDETRMSSFLGNLYVELTPFKGLSFRSSFSASVLNSRRGEYRGADSKSRLNLLPQAFTEDSLNSSYTWDNILTYKLKSGSHELTVTAVQSAFQERFEFKGTQVENLPYNSGWYAINTAPIINGVRSNLSERSILSFMGRVNYIFNEKYLLTLTGRYDGSSVLSDGNKWALFPSAALAWRLGDESFIKNLNVFSDLKLRVSYGVVGNDVVRPYSTQALMRQTAYDFGGNAAYGFAANSVGNSDLKWENSEEVNIGLNMGFVNNRIQADVEFYNKTTNDLIQNVAVPSSTGYSSFTQNVGKLLNRGIEVSLNTVNVQKGGFKWTSTINFSSNHNEVLELYGGTVDRDIANRLFVGEPLKSNYYYQFDGIWQTDEADQALAYNQVPGTVRVVDQDGNGIISASAGQDDRVILGSELPKWIGGITNIFTYKNWDLSFFIYTRQGSQFRNAMLNGTFGDLGNGRYNKLNLNYWTAENPSNEYHGVWQANNPWREAVQYKKASFWRVQNITLGYNVPASLLGRLNMSTARLYLQAENPFLFVKEKNIWMDPEFNSATFRDDVPFSIFRFGVNLSL